MNRDDFKPAAGVATTIDVCYRIGEDFGYLGALRDVSRMLQVNGVITQQALTAMAVSRLIDADEVDA